MDFYDIEMYEVSKEELEALEYSVSVPVSEPDPEDDIPY